MFIVVLICTIVLVWVLAGAVSKVPAVFYVLALVLDIVYALGASDLVTLPLPVWHAVVLLVQKCSIALALFAVVMFIGAFSSRSRVSTHLKPVRAELSIIACILTLGHVSAYITSFLARALSGAGSIALISSLAVAFVSFVLMVVLGITSINAVKKRMRGESWKRLQRLAYVFFGLTYVHLVLMLAPSALAGGAAALQSVAVYTIVFGAYAVARVVRWRLDVSESESRNEAVQV